MKSLFDTLALAVEKPSRMPILDPVTKLPLKDAETGEEAYIDLLSWDSPVAAQHRIERADRMRRLGRDLNAAEAEDDLRELLAKLTTGWLLVGLDGRRIPADCTFANAVALYGMHETRWIRLQVVDHLNNAGNWRPAGSSSS